MVLTALHKRRVIDVAPLSRFGEVNRPAAAVFPDLDRVAYDFAQGESR